MVKEAESARAQMIATPGKQARSPNFRRDSVQGAQVHRSTELDEEYLVVGGHVDEALRVKIVNFEYIDFARLLLKDKILKSEDNRLELVFKNGATYFTPVFDRETSAITNFNRWEQAFRIFSNVLTQAHPHKAGELIQYNHIIYTAALTFQWDNVYFYDREFRMHISNFPHRSWAVILQQAWSMCLKDRVKTNQGGSGMPASGKTKINEPCHRYNKGKCTYGLSCRYQHRCSVPKCGKYSHGAHICRRCQDANNSGSGESGSSKHLTGESKISDKLACWDATSYLYCRYLTFS